MPIPAAMVSHDKKVILHPILIILNYRIQCLPLARATWFHMTQKSHVAHHFDCLDLRNEVVPLMMTLVSHDTHTSASDGT